jgi:hypothetical protein
VNAVKAASAGTVRDPARKEAGPEKLAGRNHTVLPGRDLRDRPIRPGLVAFLGISEERRQSA